ncbi:unnamed protein product [Aphis gossypii]|uniref:Uncharacterized protein n=1 Tax=Aphis gossypii TaxID=80765 RepID=A0A9P0J2I0_APHGO|nr:unnamed protein product [Aphis gossypii]
MQLQFCSVLHQTRARQYQFIHCNINYKIALHRVYFHSYNIVSMSCVYTAKIVSVNFIPGKHYRNIIMFSLRKSIEPHIVRDRYLREKRIGIIILLCAFCFGAMVYDNYFTCTYCTYYNITGYLYDELL